LEYEKIAENNYYFHFHKPVSQENLANEINKYHFGLIPFFIKDTQISSEKIKYATSLKLFNYIEAGVPVILSKDLIYQSWIVERYHAGIVISPDDLLNIKKIVTTVDYKIITENLIKNRQELSLKKHIPRLIKFYKQIAQE